MKNGVAVGALAYLMMCLTGLSTAQTISVFDTVYVPSGYSDGPGTARIYVPEIGNGIGMVLVHGAGGSRTDSHIWCDTLASYGYVAMSIEYPDPSVTARAVYPAKTRAVKLAVEFLRRNAARFGITTGKIVGWGMSQGAATWGEAIIWDNDDTYFQTDPTVDDHVNAAVLLYGFYTPAPVYWDAYFNRDSLRVMKGTCVNHVGNITTPVLLMHGTADGGVPYEKSVQLRDSLVARGKVSQLVLFNGQAHVFDLNYAYGGTFTPAGLIAKDTTLAFLRRIVAPQLKIHVITPSIDFGNIMLVECDTATAGISNIGSTPLIVNSIANASPQFTLLNLASFPAVVHAGGVLRFRIAFRPSVQGIALDTIRIATNDSLHQLVRITLRGKGVPAIHPASAGVLYAASNGVPEGYLYSINTSTGAVGTIGGTGTPEIHGMAIRHSDGVLYASCDSSTATTLYRINSQTGDAVRSMVIPVGNLHAIAFSPGDTLFGATTTGSLYRIDLTAGSADLVGTTRGLSYSGLAFRPGMNQLWASVRTPIDSIFTVNTTNGAATFVGVTGFNALTNSIAFDPRGNLFGLIDNGTREDYFAAIDTLTGTGVIIAGPLSVGGLQTIAMRTDHGAASVREHHGGDIPRTNSLGQNYPNPFNPTTKIGYEIRDLGFVTLKIYDVLGREISTLVNEVKQPGTYETTFDAAGLASGVYFYRLQAGNFVATKRLLLMK